MPPTSAVDQIDNSHGGSSHSIGIETGDKKVAATRRTTTELRPTDVLIGRGALINSYLGNVNYRRLVRA
jgi:hypothetical protein